MFDISMLDMRVGQSRDESCALQPVLADALYAVAPFAVARRTTLARAPICEDVVAIGADRLAQITINILENAIKHGRESGNVALSVHALDGRYVEIRVDDDGPGVVDNEREEIFALAKRGENASSKGAGIGLAIVRLMVERIGGEVDVMRSPFGGAQFRVRLPLASR